jgi:hypothetical protein
MIQAGFARIAAGLADPPREAMLVALANGRASRAGEPALPASRHKARVPICESGSPHAESNRPPEQSRLVASPSP